VGAPLAGFLDAQAAASLSGLLPAAEDGVSRGEVRFRRGEGSVPTHVSLTLLPLEGEPVFCMIVTDLTERQSARRRSGRRSDASQVARAAAEEANRTAQEEIEWCSRSRDRCVRPRSCGPWPWSANGRAPEPRRRRPTV